MKIGRLAILSLVISVASLVTTSAQAQPVDTKRVTWQDKLYDKSVDYGSFACKNAQPTVVDEFFKARPLNPKWPVCHNNCAILVAFSKTPLPPTNPKIKGNGFVAVHILVNEAGEPIYARALNGHPVIRTMVENRGCEATFMPAETKRQRVILFCVSGDCDQPQPVL